MRFGCSCAHKNEDGYNECAVTGDQCMYHIPNAWACAKKWGEGPCVIPDPEEHWLPEDRDDIEFTFEMDQDLVDYLTEKEIEIQFPIRLILMDPEKFIDPDNKNREIELGHNLDAYVTMDYAQDEENKELYHFKLHLHLEKR